ncbi:MAG: hypothetical protein IPM61_16485 [Chlorobi bacterium]|nr:hypothetical protein [Chlorobiota bacterium]
MARLLCFIVCFIALFASVALLPAQTGGITVTPRNSILGWNELTITAPGEFRKSPRSSRRTWSWKGGCTPARTKSG